MTEIKIYFQDLTQEAQEGLWHKVEKNLLEYGDIAPKARNESEEEFRQRLEEEADHYINTHNFANRFLI